MLIDENTAMNGERDLNPKRKQISLQKCYETVLANAECKRGHDIFEYSKHNHYCACSIREHSTTFDWPRHNIYKNIDTSTLETESVEEI